MALGNDGRTVVTTAGTRVVLATDTPCQWVTVIAATSNTGQINVGDVSVVAATGSTERGVPLLAGDSATLEVHNLNTVWLDSRVSGEAVTYLYGG